jgi:hypothetical protein
MNGSGQAARPVPNHLSIPLSKGDILQTKKINLFFRQKG